MNETKLLTKTGLGLETADRLTVQPGAIALCMHCQDSLWPCCSVVCYRACIESRVGGGYAVFLQVTLTNRVEAHILCECTSSNHRVVKHHGGRPGSVW